MNPGPSCMPSSCSTQEQQSHCYTNHYLLNITEVLYAYKREKKKHISYLEVLGGRAGHNIIHNNQWQLVQPERKHRYIITLSLLSLLPRKLLQTGALNGSKGFKQSSFIILIQKILMILCGTHV